MFCHEYLNEDNFIVHIANLDNTEFLFLLKSSKEMNVDLAISKVAELEKKGKALPLKMEDYFEMPFIELSCERKLT